MRIKFFLLPENNFSLIVLSISIPVRVWVWYQTEFIRRLSVLVTHLSVSNTGLTESSSNLTVIQLIQHVWISSVQFSRSVVSDSLRPHASQHARPPCPSPTPGVYSNSRPLSRWYHPAISSSVVPFSSCPQSLPASGSFPMSQLSTWGGQSIGVSASASVLPMNTQEVPSHKRNRSLPFSAMWVDMESKDVL